MIGLGSADDAPEQMKMMCGRGSPSCKLHEVHGHTYSRLGGGGAGGGEAARPAAASSVFMDCPGFSDLPVRTTGCTLLLCTFEQMLHEA